MKQKVLILSLIASFVVYLVVLGLVVSNSPSISAIDIKITSFITDVRSQPLLAFMTYITRLGDTAIPTVLTLLACIVLAVNNKIKDTIFFSGTMLSALVIKSFNKVLVDRLRPIGGVISVTESSFPSGHAMLSLIFFSLTLFYIYPFCKTRHQQHLITWIGALLIFLIGFSRIYLGVHWFTDVVGGYLLGIAWLSLALLVYKNIK